MRANLVGRSVVSAITHTPASGPLDPVTVPPMSLSVIFWASAGALTNAAASNAKRLLMVPSSVEPAAYAKKNGTRGSRFLATRSRLDRGHARAAAAAVPHHEGNHERDQEEEEQHFGDSRSCA